MSPDHFPSFYYSTEVPLDASEKDYGNGVWRRAEVNLVLFPHLV